MSDSYMTGEFRVSYEALSLDIQKTLLEKCRSFSENFDPLQEIDNRLSFISINDEFAAFWTKDCNDNFIWFWLGSKDEYNTTNFSDDISVNLCWITSDLASLDFTSGLHIIYQQNVAQESNFIQLDNAKEVLISYSLKKANIIILLVNNADSILRKSKDLLTRITKQGSVILINLGASADDFEKISVVLKNSSVIDYGTEEGLNFKKISGKILDILRPATSKKPNPLDVFAVDSVPLHNAVDPCSLNEIIHSIESETYRILTIEAAKKSGKTTTLRKVMEQSTLLSKEVDLKQSQEISIQADIKLIFADNYYAANITKLVEKQLKKHISSASDTKLVLFGDFFSSFNSFGSLVKKEIIYFKSQKIIDMIEIGEEKLQVSILYKEEIPTLTNNNIRMSQFICQHLAIAQLNDSTLSFNSFEESIDFIMNNGKYNQLRGIISSSLMVIDNNSKMAQTTKNLCQETLKAMLKEDVISVDNLVLRNLGGVAGNEELLVEHTTFLQTFERNLNLYISKRTQDVKYFEYNENDRQIKVYREEIEFLLCLKHTMSKFNILVDA
jgi:hypothetical protein